MKLIASLEECVQEAQQSMNGATLANMDQTFKTIHMEEESWQSLCQEKGYCKWPLQKTWQEAYGGYLFYPKKEIDKYKDFHPTRYLLNRKDIISGLEISMTYNYPVAQFTYLDRPYLDPQSEKYYDTIFKKAVKGLLEDEGAEAVKLKVHYLLTYADEELEDRIEEVIELLNRSPSVENRLQALNIRFRHKDCLIRSQPSTKEEFLSFADRENCGFAFRSAVDHFEDSFSWEEKINLLTKAFELGDMHALCMLGDFYDEKGDKEKALEYYIQYAKNGYSYGYTSAVFLYYNPITQPSTGEIADILKARELAEQGAVMNDSTAAAYLSTITHKFNLK